MGYSFTLDGLFKDWSCLFDYSSELTLLASLLLPMPSLILLLKAMSLDKHKLDIQADLDRINSLIDSGQKVKVITEEAKLLKKIQEFLDKYSLKKRGKKYVPLIYKSSSDTHNVIKKLQDHENTILDEDELEDIYKNSTSAGILLTVSDIRNIPLAYSPITMDDLLDAANESPKGTLIYSLTGMNPATKFIMLKLNMDGKAVIGISAVGEKVFMGLSYYFNEGIRLAENGDTDLLRHMLFINTTNRIFGRYDGNPLLCIKTRISDTNFRYLSDPEVFLDRLILVNNLRTIVTLQHPDLKGLALELEINKVIESNRSNNTLADLMISLLLSAATDNAKELILSKINAGKDLARIYLHLLILGYDIKDIVAFMISPAVEVVSDLANTNLFDEYDNLITITKAIKKARGYLDITQYITGYEKVDPEFLSDLDPEVLARYKNPTKATSFIRNFLNYLKILDSNLYEDFSEMYLLFKRAKEGQFFDPLFMTDEVFSNLFIKFIDPVNHSLIRSIIEKYILENYKLADVRLNIQTYYDEAENLALKIKKAESQIYDKKGLAVNDYYADLDELEKVYEASEEPSNLGTLLGFNRGIDASYADILAKVNTVERMVDSKTKKYELNKLKETDGLLDDKDVEKMTKTIVTIKPYLTEDFIINTIKKAYDLGITKSFSFNSYLLNKDYQKVAIDYYDIIKDQYNILDVVMRIPYYKAAMEAFNAANLLIELSSIKGIMTSMMRTKLKDIGVVLREKEFNKLLTYSEELLINDWLKQEDIKFPINNGQSYYTEDYQKLTKNNGSIMESLDTSYKRSSFKLWVELYLLPAIASKESNANGKIEIQFGDNVIEIPKNNEFVKYLTDGTENGTPIKKLSILMNSVETDMFSALKYLKAVNGLRDLNIKIDPNNPNSLTLSDYIMLYSIITTRNTPGNDRLTNMFHDLIDREDSLMSRYLLYIGAQDYKSKKFGTNQKELFLEKLGFDIDDALFKIAPTYSEYSKHKAKEKIIRIVGRNGVIHYEIRTRQGYQNYDRLNFLSVDSDLSEDERNQSVLNFSDDGILFLPSLDGKLNLMSKLQTKYYSGIKDALLSLINQGYLKITINC